VAQLEGRSLAFVDAIARVLWGPHGEALGRARSSRARRGTSRLRPRRDGWRIAADPDRCEAIVTTNEKDRAASGHWGAPTFVFEKEPFFGQDRIDLLIWCIQSKGLARRDGR
jgi:2-hydroxychromene-2-carboxylate isomerase